MTDPLDPLFTNLILTAVGLLVASGFMSSFVSSRRLKRWAQEEGVTILRRRYATGLGSEHSVIGLFGGWCYYVKIEDKEKRVFLCWVRVGGLIAAFRDTKIRVMWDNRPTYLW
jgi:hypothetical protein